MTCKCCRQYIETATFAEVSADTCSDCQLDHDRSHRGEWRDAARAGE